MIYDLYGAAASSTESPLHVRHACQCIFCQDLQTHEISRALFWLDDLILASVLGCLGISVDAVFQGHLSCSPPGLHLIVPVPGRFQMKMVATSQLGQRHMICLIQNQAFPGG